MAWGRMDDAFDDHPKVLALLDHEDGATAIGLWTLCWSWAHRNTRQKGKTPGLLPASLPRRFIGPRGRELADLLVKVGLWDPAPSDDGWLIHDFADYLPTDKTREARAEAGRKGAAKRWGNRPSGDDGPGGDSKLPSGSDNEPVGSHHVDDSPMAADGTPDPDGTVHAQSLAACPEAARGGGKLIPLDGKLLSVCHADDGKPIATNGSHTPARWAIPNGIAPVPTPDVPPSAGAIKLAPTAQSVVAAYVEGAAQGGLDTPSQALRNRVGKQARDLLRQKKPIEKLVEAARRMGAIGWDDLDRQLQRDSAKAVGANANGQHPRGGASDDLSDEVYGEGGTRI